MSPASAAELVSSVVSLATTSIESVKQIHDWLEGNGAKPDEALAQLPDTTRAHLELAALEKLAAKNRG